MISFFFFFFFNDTATTEIYTLSLHDALPISFESAPLGGKRKRRQKAGRRGRKRRETPWKAKRTDPDRTARSRPGDRKSTRLNSSHGYISYAVFCLKKKKKN